MAVTAEANWAALRSRVADMRRYMRVLRAYGKREDSTFLKDKEAVRSARYAFIVAVDAAAAICLHLSARLYGRAPDSYSDCFDHLAAEEVIEAELAERLAALARFRNLLIHRYGPIDDGQLLELIRTNLEDLNRYVRQLGKEFPELTGRRRS